jgi:hypothetical protein
MMLQFAGNSGLGQSGPTGTGLDPQIVMAGLVPAIHVFLRAETKTWMPGTSPGMTNSYSAFLNP